MGKLRIRFHWSFIILSIFLIVFKEIELLLSMILAVVFHEIGHFYVADKLGYELNLITLMPYGASLSGKELYIEPKHEILISIAGPLTSLILAILFIALWWIFPELYNYSQTFVFANMSIFVVNLFPCFPLDGGRILNSLLKKKFPQKNSLKITKIVSMVVIVILTILYIISAFYEINYSLCAFSLFLTIGLMFNEDVEKYSLKTKTFIGVKNTKKGVGVNIKAISNTSNLLELYKILDPNSLNYILVLDKLNNTNQTLKDKDIEFLLKKYPLDTMLKDIKIYNKEKEIF